jgi:phage terminase small subunit
MKLENAKHERFCQEYIIDLNGAKAYERTYDKVKAARIQACKLLTKANIQERIAELKEIRSERTVVTQDMVVRELLILATSDFKDYGEIVDPYGTKTTQRLKLKKFSEMKGDVTKAIKSISEHVTKDGIQLKFKLHGKEKALEMLGRHTGIFDESMRIETEIDKDNKLIIEVVRVREGEDKSK